MDRPTVGSVQILRGNALALALADEARQRHERAVLIAAWREGRL